MLPRYSQKFQRSQQFLALPKIQIYNLLYTPKLVWESENVTRRWEYEKGWEIRPVWRNHQLAFQQ